MKVVVTGATGYIGGRLIPRLLEQGHEVRVLVRDGQRVQGRPWSEQVEVHEGDLLEPATLEGVAQGMDAAYYLVHSMSAGQDFEQRDRVAVRHFIHAVDDADSVEHVIYLGGLLPEGGVESASSHLHSRAEVGRMLRDGLPATEFRAGPIIGSGSASFEMVRYLTERLPAMVAPKWILNTVQPIAVRDVMSYLLGALDTGPVGVVEIGGERLTFKQMMQVYAQLRGLKRWIVPVPVLAPRLAARWVGFVTPISNRLAVPLVEGVIQSLLVADDSARRQFPDIHPIPYREAVSYALDKTEQQTVETRFSDALGPSQSVALTDSEGMIREVRQRHVDLPPRAVFRGFTSLGGDTGWLVWGWAWRVRGVMDQLVGGPGLRRGRRDPQALLPGEALDFWRVEAVDPDRLLRLRAEMYVPGKAWLQFECVAEEGGGTRLTQTALFAPRGLPGVLYWYALYPVHRFIFTDMVNAVAKHAERFADDDKGSVKTGLAEHAESQPQ